MCLKGDICTYPKCGCNTPRRTVPIRYGNILWRTKHEYIPGDLCVAMGQTWKCVTEHTSNIFGTDALENKYWKEWEYD